MTTPRSAARRGRDRAARWADRVRGVHLAVRARTVSPRAALGALLLGALTARLIALFGDGYMLDVDGFVRWAELLALVGPTEFYRHELSVYPAYLYLLWPIGAWLDGEPLRLVLKGASIPFACTGWCGAVR